MWPAIWKGSFGIIEFVAQMDGSIFEEYTGKLNFNPWAQAELQPFIYTGVDFFNFRKEAF